MADVNKTIEVTLKGQTAPLKSALSSVDGVTEKTSKKIADDLDKAFKKSQKAAQRSTKSINKSFKGLKVGAAAAAGAGLAIAGAMAVGAKAVFDFARQIGDLTNQLADASARSGLTIQQLQALSLALEGSGLSLQQMEPALDKFPLRMKNAAEGSKKLSETFKKLGVEVKNTDGTLRSTSDVFNDTIVGLGQIENKTEQAAVAMELFGRQGGMLIQSGVIQGMEAFNDLVSEFGLKTGKNAVASAANMQRALADLKMVAFGTGQALLEAFTGKQFSITDLIDTISKGIIVFGTIVEDVGTHVSSRFQAMMTPLQAMSLIMQGEFQKAAIVAREQVDNYTQSTFTLGKSLFRANKRLEKFTKLSKAARAAAGTGAGGRAGGAGGGSIAGASTAAAEEQLNLDQMINQVLSIRKTVNSDLVTQEQAIQNRLNEQLQTLQNIQEKSKGQVDITAAQNEAISRSERDLAALKAKLAAEEKRRKDEEHREELEKIAERKQAELDARNAVTEAALSSAFTIADSLATISQNQISHLEQRKEKGLEIIEKMEKSGQLTAVAAAKQRRALETETANKIKEESMKAFNIKKAVATSTAIIDAISASVRAFADYPFPTSAAISAAAFGAAIAQVAAIQSQPPPTFDIGGMVGNRDPLAPDAVNANLLAGEAVLSRQDVRKLGGPAGLKRLQQGGGAGGGVVVVSPFKHFDKFVSSSLKRPSRLRSLIGSSSTGSIGY